MTPTDFFNRYGVDPKALRRYLRQRWPHEHNAAWWLDDAMVRDALNHFDVRSARRDEVVHPSESTVPATPNASQQSRNAISSLQLARAEEVLTSLTAPSNAVAPRSFPTNPALARNAGMYAWWADDDAQSVLGRALGCKLPALIYVGQAGATQWPSGTPSNATLLSRIQSQHIRGNARSSTFRLTISALLLDELGLSPVLGGRLESASNSVISAWISSHLRVAIAPWEDRDSLSKVEAHVVRTINPPLNLDHCAPTPERAILSKLRTRVARN